MSPLLLCALLATAAHAQSRPGDCKPIYLTLDTGNMRDAQDIAAFLKQRHIQATFFLANEKTTRDDFALDPSWASFWKERAQEGHAFGSHTWRHGKISAGNGGSIQYKPQFGESAGQVLGLDSTAFCAELKQVDSAFKTYTGRGLDPIWRAPGGRLTPAAEKAASACGFAHVGWATAGFLGDELNSDAYPNALLEKRALASIAPGDILMAHLGIWSRKERFFPAFRGIVAGLQDRGFCFKTLAEHPDYRSAFARSAGADAQKVAGGRS